MTAGGDQLRPPEGAPRRRPRAVGISSGWRGMRRDSVSLCNSRIGPIICTCKFEAERTHAIARSRRLLSRSRSTGDSLLHPFGQAGGRPCDGRDLWFIRAGSLTLAPPGSGRASALITAPQVERFCRAQAPGFAAASSGALPVQLLRKNRHHRHYGHDLAEESRTSLHGCRHGSMFCDPDDS